MKANEKEIEHLIPAEFTEGPNIALAREMFAKCSDREKAFINEYLHTPIAAEAARRSGNGKTDNAVRIAGHRILNRPHVREIIELLLDESNLIQLALTERVKRNAQANLSQYMRKAKRIRYGKMYLTGEEYIDRKEREDRELRAFMRSRTFTVDEDVHFKARLRSISDDITWAEIRLETDPDKLYIVDEDPVLEEYAEIDCAKLVGTEDIQITALSYDKQGNLKVKIASTDAAQDMLARFGGRYKLDNEQKVSNTFVISEDDARVGMAYDDAEEIESEDVE